MSTKSKSIHTKSIFNQDDRLKKVSPLKMLLNRPELGALGGAILVFIFLVLSLVTRVCSAPLAC
jgi:simple sugar transport system permease protein